MAWTNQEKLTRLKARLYNLLYKHPEMGTAKEVLAFYLTYQPKDAQLIYDNRLTIFTYIDKKIKELQKTS